MLNKIDGYKSYATAIVTAIVAVVDLIGYDVPESIYAMLVAAIAIALRHAISKTEMEEVNAILHDIELNRINTKPQPTEN